MNRFFQVLLIVCTAGLSWLLMMAFHESGHALHGWLSGAQETRVHLPLLGFSHTDFAVNPHPLFVAWGGAIWGCLFPLGVLAAVRIAVRCRLVAESLAARLFLITWLAGFCLIANGGYLLGGAFYRGGGDDGGVILQHGGSRWQLIGFGTLAIVAGLWCWNGLGRQFGLGNAHGEIDRTAAISAAIVLLVVACAELLFSTICR